MISRVAEACFWMYRHMERADATARLLRVNQSYVLDAPLAPERKWYPLLVVSGEHKRFAEEHSGEESDGAKVQEYLAWDMENPVSIFSAVYWARENAQTIRNVVSLGMWEVLNELWHWLRGGSGRRLYSHDVEAFYARISQSSAMFLGTSHNTILYDTPFDFMRLGMLLERAGQTARVLDVHHHTFDGAESPSDDALASIQWLAVLAACSGTTPFLRQRRAAPTGSRVVEFLVLNPGFPRSVLHCLERAQSFLERVRPDAQRGLRSWELLSELTASFQNMTGPALAERGVHQEMTRIVDGTIDVCNAIHDDYFDPEPVVPSSKPTSGAQPAGAENE